MAKSNKVLSKVVHLYAGVDLIGSKTTINYKEAEIEVTPIGMRVISKKTGRIILIPFSNVKGAELFPQDSEDDMIEKTKLSK